MQVQLVEQALAANAASEAVIAYLAGNYPLLPIRRSEADTPSRLREAGLLDTITAAASVKECLDREYGNVRWIASD